MKNDTIIHSVEKSAGLEEHEGQIHNSAEAFDTLAKKIYTNVPLAIVRELSTNAYDAQVDAGTRHQPFDVHLPTYQEPYFSIRDYGTGLSDTDIKSVFLDCFRSTRTNSNDHFGHFGLGSKTPFALTNSFSVTSYFNGIAKFYCLYKNDNRKNAIAQLHEEPTTEHNGLLIKIDVPTKDINAFQEAAIEVYEYFDVRPNFNHQVTFPPKEILYDLNGNLVLKQGLTTITVLLGQLQYYCDTTKIQTNINKAIVIKANIGECSVATSREELHYDAKTIDFITSKIKALEKHLENELAKELAKSNNLLDQYYAAKSANNILRNTFAVPALPTESECVEIGISRNKHFSNRVDAFYYNFPRTRPIIIEQDIEWDNRTKRYFKAWYDDQKRYWLYKPSSPEFLKNFCDRADIKLSEIPKPARQQRHNISAKQFVKRITDYGLATIDEIDTNKACYLVKKYDSVIINGCSYSHLFATIVKIAELLGFDKVYAISGNKVKALKGDLINLDDEMRMYANRIFKNLTEFEKSRMTFGSNFDLDFLNNISGLSPEADDLFHFSNARRISNLEESILRWYNLIDTKTIINYPKRFFDRYPLLSYCHDEMLKTEGINYIIWKEQCLSQPKGA